MQAAIDHRDDVAGTTNAVRNNKSGGSPVEGHGDPRASDGAKVGPLSLLLLNVGLRFDGLLVPGR